MNQPKCVMCGSLAMLGPSHASSRFNSGNPVDVAVHFTDGEGNHQHYSGVARASVCLDCGHIALFASEKLRTELRNVAAQLRPYTDE